MVKLVAILTILSAYAFSVNAQWKVVTSPGGGDVKSLVSGGSTLYTVTPSGVFKLNEGGAWVLFSQNLSGQIIYAIACIDHVVFAATFNGVYRTQDNGSTWSRVFDKVGCIAITTSKEDEKMVIYVSTVSNVYKSVDNGSTWTDLGSPILNGISSILVVNKNVFATTTWGAGLYRLKRNEVSWSAAVSGSIEVTPGLTTIDSTLYILKDANLYRSTDFGFSWNFVYNLGAGYLAAIGKTLFFSNSSSLRKSVNGGNSWSSVGAVTGLAFNSMVVHGSALYGGSISGMYKSTDVDGTSWTLFSNGLSPKVTDMKFVGNNLWLGTNSGLFVSDNNGISWSHVTQVPSFQVSSIYSDDDNSMYVGTLDRGLFYSTNAGQSWTCINPDIKSIKSITKDNNDLYIASNTTGLYRMREGAWSRITPMNFTSVAAKNGVLHGANYQAYYSLDGATWTLSPLTPVSSSAAVYTINDTIFLSRNELFRYSTDGVTWTQPSGFSDFGFVYDMIAHDNVLYVATNFGIYRSVDRAASWHQIHSPSSTLLAAHDNTLYSGKNYSLAKKDLVTELSHPNDLPLFTGLTKQPSKVQRFVIEYDLLPGDISVSVGSGFEFQVSYFVDYGAPFSPSAEIKLSNSRFTTLQVRLNSNILGPVADSIIIQCAGMPTRYVPINGLVVEKFSQTIDFSEIENTNTADRSVKLTATASSGLPISFETANTDLVSLADGRAYILGAGEVTITAHQPGDDFFFPAEAVSRTFTVDLVLGIEPHKNSNIQVYPNPTTGIVRLADNAELIGLTNVMGQPQVFERISGTLDLRRLPPGVYLLTIRKQSKIYITSILKN